MMAAKTDTNSSPRTLLRRWPLTTATLGLGGLALGALIVSACASPDAEPKVAVRAADDSSEEAEKAIDTPQAPGETVTEEIPVVEEDPSPDGNFEFKNAAAKDGADPAAGMPMDEARPTSTAKPAAAPKRKKGRSAGRDSFDDKVAMDGLFGGGEAGGLGGPGGSGGLEDADMEGEGDGRFGKYDNGIQARQLTAGTQDDIADDQGYAKYLRESQTFIDRLDVPQSYLDIKPNLDRHAEQPRAVQIALVIDTTSSMSDELEYLKVEMRSIATKVGREFPGVEQEFALIAYRDHGDEYLVHAGGFQSLQKFVDDLGTEFSGGGGDYPEAMDEAMEHASELKWDRGGKTAKMVFLVADAPPHHGSGVSKYLEEVETLRGRDVAMYPVAASGVDDETELLMRTSAHATGGQYIFLTDHSGVGNGHKDPNVDQYKVKTLHDAMLEMIRTELGAQEAQRVQPVVDVMPEPQAHVESQALVTNEEAPQGFWARLIDAVGDHFGFAALFALGLFAAIGVDATFGKKNKS